MKLTPNIKRLWTTVMARNAIPAGGGFYDGLKFLSSKESVSKGAREAEKQVKEMIDLVRNAKAPNPYKDFDDEDIAKMLINKIEERKREKVR